MNIGGKIASARRELGITQIELAEQLNVTRQTVSRWEANAAMPDLETVVRLAKILHVSCDNLMMEDSNECDEVLQKKETEIKEDASALSRLLMTLPGKCVEINFYDGEEDFDTIGRDCFVEGFEGNWIRISLLSKKEKKTKLISLSSIQSFLIKETKED